MVTVIASFLIAVLSGIGVGGGGLFVVFLAMFTDIPQVTVQGMNLLFFLFSSGSAVCVHLTKRQIFGSAVLIMAVFGILGALLGAHLATLVSNRLLRKVFGAMLVISGILTLQKKESRPALESAEMKKRGLIFRGGRRRSR